MPSENGSDETDWRGSGLRNAEEIGSEGRENVNCVVCDDRSVYKLQLATASEAGAGSWSAPAQRAIVDVTEAPTGRLDVSLGPGGFLSLPVVGQGIQARQTGACRQEYGKKEEGLDPEEPPARCRARTMHEVEYTHLP